MENKTTQPVVTHWKKLTNPNYLGAHDLQPGEELVITIESVGKELIKGDGGKSEQCVVAKLRGCKPMILNKTNMKLITSILETPFVEQWAGKSITLYATKVKAFDEVVDALRVKITSVTHEEVKALFDQKFNLLNNSEVEKAKRILDKKEVNSYKKLHKFLSEKNG